MNEYRPENNNYGSEPPKKKRSTGKIIAIVVVCVLLAAAAGVGTGVLLSSFDGVSLVHTNHMGSVPNAVPTAAPDIPASDVELDTTIIDGGNKAPVNKPNVEYTGKTLSASELYSMAVNSCVGIKTDVTMSNIFGQVTSSAISGSGFIISTDGYILTNYHVVEHADTEGLPVTVTMYDGSEYTAEIIGKEADNDVALLKIDGRNLPALVLNTSGDLTVGQNVYAIGNPLGELTYTLTDGIVSALDREIAVESNVSIGMFQISAAINSGNSGGPVFNDKGEVIGIASAKYADTGVEGLGFAIPIEDAMDIVDDLIKYGFVRGKPYFGITVRTVTPTVAEYYGMVVGAYIDEVDQNSCAAAAGLARGDIIVKMNDTEISSSSDLILAKKEYVAGDTVTLNVFRNGEYFETVITFDEEGARAHLGKNG